MEVLTQYTAQQAGFISAVVDGDRNIALVARAGSGKTSTILGAVSALVRKFPTAEISVCAYNKAIADEVAEKLRKAGHNDWRRVAATTMHAMGFGLLKYVFKAEVDDKKVRKLCDFNRFEGEEREVMEQYSSQIETLVRFAKQAGFGFFAECPIGSVDAWHALADHFGINGLEDTSQMDAVVAVAQKVYKTSLNQTDVIDFDDMILFPLIKNLRVKFGKDYIFLDEAQDLSRTRQALARKFLKASGRMFIVGDDCQAIYGFSGADAAALDNMVKSLNAVRMPLSVTWRCPQAVVRLAQTLVPDIEAAPGAAEGEVSYTKVMPDDIQIGDAILCRNTAPLIKQAYALIRAGKPAKVEGRQIGEGLEKLATRWKVKEISTLLTRLDDYRAREVQKAMAKDNEAKAEEVNDRVETLIQICNACQAKNKHTIQDIKDFIANLFADDVKNAIVLATYHRSKGREWNRVILIEHSKRCPSKAARQEWQMVQERNLAYVAFTRAQNTLMFYEAN